MLKRSHYCQEINAALEGKPVILNGWLLRKRLLGKVVFLVLRDKTGSMQIVLDITVESLIPLSELPLESCFAVKGTVRKRPAEMVNPSMETGEWELQVEHFEVFSTASTPPFPLENPEHQINESLKLEYRYLDLRHRKLTKNLQLRSQLEFYCHQFFTERNFTHISTPTLVRPTSEGAREYLVPSRIHQGTFFALSQSPQLYKQLCMIGGLDRYYQIARCYRDEDFRGDRQAEFTQLDFEISFQEQQDILALGEEFIKGAFLFLKGIDVSPPFLQMPYQQAMAHYGTDKPDLRSPLIIQDFSHSSLATIPFFAQILQEGGSLKGFVLENSANEFSRKVVDQLSEQVAYISPSKLAFFKVGSSSLEGGLAKWLNARFQELQREFSFKEGTTFLLLADSPQECLEKLGIIRLEISHHLNLIDLHTWSFLWVTDFPLFLWDAPNNRFTCSHHPFTMPHPQDISLLKDHPLKARGQLYDLVINGVELASGSIRIHQKSLQEQILTLLNLSPLEQEQVQFFCRALDFGAPPHGGMALGLDRLAMLLSGETSLKEVIAFPRTNTGVSPLDGSPSAVLPEKLQELFSSKKPFS